MTDLPEEVREAMLKVGVLEAGYTPGTIGAWRAEAAIKAALSAAAKHGYRIEKVDHFPDASKMVDADDQAL